MALRPEHIELIKKIVTSRGAGSVVVDDVQLDQLRDALRAAVPVLERQLEGERRRAEKRATSPRSHQPWSLDEENRIWQLHRAGTPVDLIAQAVERHVDAVKRRLGQRALRDGNPRALP